MLSNDTLKKLYCGCRYGPFTNNKGIYTNPLKKGIKSPACQLSFLNLISTIQRYVHWDTKIIYFVPPPKRF